MDEVSEREDVRVGPDGGVEKTGKVVCELVGVPLEAEDESARGALVQVSGVVREDDSRAAPEAQGVVAAVKMDVGVGD